MKYIRTKDGIYKTREYIPDETIFENKQPVYQHEHINKKDIIKQADTIEELCDEFILVDEENEHYINQQNDIHHIRRKWAIGDYNVYGAIWIDKGLIYVSKMNVEGESELL